MRIKTVLMTGAAALIIVGMGTAVPAYAETFVTPFAGATFGKDAPTSKFSTGVSLTSMDNVAGLEIELGYTPDFFNQQRGDAIVSNSNVTSLMANLVIGPGHGPVKPYVVGGVGLLRSHVGGGGSFFDSITTNDWGVDLGAGILVRIGRGVDVRGDLRYFRSLQKSDPGSFSLALGNFDFYRGTIGVAFRI